MSKIDKQLTIVQSDAVKTFSNLTDLDFVHSLRAGKNETIFSHKHNNLQSAKSLRSASAKQYLGPTSINTRERS